jgi:predicted Abi (CAAX) family protease
MGETTLEHLWELLGGIFSLNPAIFERVYVLSDAWRVALIVVLAAGLCRGVAESIVLFVNQVKPLRFGLSLLLEAILFTFGYLFWAGSIWLAGYLFLPQDIPFKIIAMVLGLSYAPYLFSFLGAMPYLGMPILRALAVWNLLAMAVGFSALAHIRPGEAFWHVIWGWIVLQVLQQTIGQPIVNLGRWLANRVAGVQLITQRQALAKTVEAEPQSVDDSTFQAQVEPQGEPQDEPLSTARPVVVPAAVSAAAQAGAVTAAPALTGLLATLPWLLSPRIQRGLQYVGLALLSCLVVVLFIPLRQWLLGLDQIGGDLGRLMADLIWIGAVALVIGALLAPLEALGWWAGWYGEGIETDRRGSPAASASALPTAERYVVYLDGIGQTTRDYQPAVANFLKELAQRLPEEIILIEGLMSYSVLNRPLTEDRPLAFFWRWAAALQGRAAGLVGILVNLRNVLAVAVSADLRYGPIYNRGIAQQVYDSLLHHGYQPGTPISLIGYSGGGQIAMGTFAFLSEALQVPIEVISLGGVISGNVRALEVQHLYHLVGDKDPVERIGPVVFPRRWQIVILSYWNRAKQMGKISFTSLGPVSHQGPTGMMAPNAYLPDGRSHLQQTLDRILQILRGDVQSLLPPQTLAPAKPSNYQRYLQAAFNHPDYYPLQQTPDLECYRPIGAWMGRLILPTVAQREAVGGALFEVYHAPADHQSLIGQVVPLRWQRQDPEVQDYLRITVKDVHFSAEAEYSERQGLIHPVRINHWRCVDPLESLAGARPQDDMVVALTGLVTVQDRALYLTHEPVQIGGRYYGLVTILGPVAAGSDRFQVVHFNRSSRRFDGKVEVVQIPQVVADRNGTLPAVRDAIATSPNNQAGWYIYGALDREGMFVVVAIAPRQLLRLQPDRVISHPKTGLKYIQQETWQDLPSKKGTVESVLVSPHSATPEAALAQWQIGDRALLMHVYGGIGGNQREPAAQSGIYFGHFAYGVATVIQDPLADEPRFEIHYHQIYTHNVHGLIAGTLGWSRYLGDRQWGFLGTRPICDVLVKLPAYTDPFELDGAPHSALDGLVHQLEIMTARYRIGDGTGGTYVGPANNCAQDSNQALYFSMKRLEARVSGEAAYFVDWQRRHPEQAQRFESLLRLRKALQRELLPFGSARADWSEEKDTLGSGLADYPLKTLGRGLLSWRTLLPRVASNTVAQLFLKEGAALWVLRANQVGGDNPDIEPIAPIRL